MSELAGINTVVPQATSEHVWGPQPLGVPISQQPIVPHHGIDNEEFSRMPFHMTQLRQPPMSPIDVTQYNYLQRRTPMVKSAVSPLSVTVVDEVLPTRVPPVAHLSATHNQFPARHAQTKITNIKRPSVYDGRSSCKDYLVQFEMVARLNGWDESMMAMELATNITGDARAVLADLDFESRHRYPKLERALLNRFEPDNQSETFRSELRGRFRKDSETLPELA